MSSLVLDWTFWNSVKSDSTRLNISNVNLWLASYLENLDVGSSLKLSWFNFSWSCSDRRSCICFLRDAIVLFFESRASSNSVTRWVSDCIITLISTRLILDCLVVLFLSKTHSIPLLSPWVNMYNIKQSFAYFSAFVLHFVDFLFTRLPCGHSLMRLAREHSTLRYQHTVLSQV